MDDYNFTIGGRFIQASSRFNSAVNGIEKIMSRGIESLEGNEEESLRWISNLITRMDYESKHNPGTSEYSDLSKTANDLRHSYEANLKTSYIALPTETFDKFYNFIMSNGAEEEFSERELSLIKGFYEKMTLSIDSLLGTFV